MVRAQEIQIPIADRQADAAAELPTAHLTWSRRSRFLFIVAAASACWVIPGAVVYCLIAFR
jgi:hypothetical protein